MIDSKRVKTTDVVDKKSQKRRRHILVVAVTAAGFQASNADSDDQGNASQTGFAVIKGNFIFKQALKKDLKEIFIYLVMKDSYLNLIK